jgi:hypothetical protein
LPPRPPPRRQGPRPGVRHWHCTALSWHASLSGRRPDARPGREHRDLDTPSRPGSEARTRNHVTVAALQSRETLNPKRPPPRHAGPEVELEVLTRRNLNPVTDSDRRARHPRRRRCQCMRRLEFARRTPRPSPLGPCRITGSESARPGPASDPRGGGARVRGPDSESRDCSGATVT